MGDFTIEIRDDQEYREALGRLSLVSDPLDKVEMDASEYQTRRGMADTLTAAIEEYKQRATFTLTDNRKVRGEGVGIGRISSD